MNNWLALHTCLKLARWAVLIERFVGYDVPTTGRLYSYDNLTLRQSQSLPMSGILHAFATSIVFFIYLFLKTNTENMKKKTIKKTKQSSCFLFVGPLYKNDPFWYNNKTKMIIFKLNLMILASPRCLNEILNYFLIIVVFFGVHIMPCCRRPGINNNVRKWSLVCNCQKKLFQH